MRLLRQYPAQARRPCVAAVYLAGRGIDVIVLDPQVNFDPLPVRCNPDSSESRSACTSAVLLFAI